MAPGPHPCEGSASPPGSPARQQNPHPRLGGARRWQHALRIWHQRRCTSVQQRLGHGEQRGVKTWVAFRAEQQVERRLSESVSHVRVRRVPQQPEGHLEIVALDRIVQWGVRLRVASPGVWFGAELQKHLHGLGAIGTPKKICARRRQLQWKLATSLEAEAPCIRFSPAVQQHTQRRKVCLTHALV